MDGGLPDDHNSGGGSESSSIELLTPESESTQEFSNSISSKWKPVWYTGWHTGVLACATSAVLVLFINISLTIYAASNPEYKMKGGVGTLYSGNCHKSRKIGMWLHMGINVLSTLLLSGSNYTQQCLAAPTRSEIDAAHAKRRWMDIGVPSVRNLFRIKLERRILWIAIGFTSIPLHLLYNSAVYTSLAANDFVVAVVSKDHFEPGAYSNMTETLVASPDQEWRFNNAVGTPYRTTRRYQTDSETIQLFRRVLEGYDTGAEDYDDLTTSDCTKIYNTDFVSNRRNLFLITKLSSNATYNNTILDMINIKSSDTASSDWMCTYNSSGDSGILRPVNFVCDPHEIVTNVARGLPWRVSLHTGDKVEISGCKSERTDE
ncbi:unnamed protein product, partial [Tuber aestivum]